MQSMLNLSIPSSNSGIFFGEGIHEAKEIHEADFECEEIEENSCNCSTMEI